jgi:hypothetical protein
VIGKAVGGHRVGDRLGRGGRGEVCLGDGLNPIREGDLASRRRIAEALMEFLNRLYNKEPICEPNRCPSLFC